MKITPIDISGHRFARRMRGYDPEEVRSFLNLVSGEFEKLVIETHAQKEELAQIRASIADYKERERILKETLLTAQKLAEDIKDEARKEARLILKEAEMKGTQLIDQAARKVTELEAVIQTLRTERDAFGLRVRSAVEQHLRILEMHRQEEEVEDRLRFMKKPASGKPQSGENG
ncbi:MAG TPA: DivIVA domain-containing protein [Candidatus Polarisedimenticolia bacterium]|nr:DivIVA domain-containing protein [Candidatus Polarisedimenticolia bacterium]